MSSETYSCLLRLKSSPDDDAIRMQPGSSDTHVLYVLFPDLFYVFLNLLENILIKTKYCLKMTQPYSFPDSIGDDLLLEVHDSKGKQFGRVLVQVATIADDPVIFLVPSIS